MAAQEVLCVGKQVEYRNQMPFSDLQRYILHWVTKPTRSYAKACITTLQPTPPNPLFRNGLCTAVVSNSRVSLFSQEHSPPAPLEPQQFPLLTQQTIPQCAEIALDCGNLYLGDLPSAANTPPVLTLTPGGPLSRTIMIATAPSTFSSSSPTLPLVPLSVRRLSCGISSLSGVEIVCGSQSLVRYEVPRRLATQQQSLPGINQNHSSGLLIIDNEKLEASFSGLALEEGQAEIVAIMLVVMAVWKLSRRDHVLRAVIYVLGVGFLAAAILTTVATFSTKSFGLGVVAPTCLSFFHKIFGLG